MPTWFHRRRVSLVVLATRWSRPASRERLGSRFAHGIAARIDSDYQRDAADGNGEVARATVASMEARGGQAVIYLASPYSSDDPRKRHERFRLACLVAGKLMLDGHHIFSPIAHTHPIAKFCDLPKGYDFWEKYDRDILAKCGAVFVLAIDGWRESKGVTAELAIARELGLPTIVGISGGMMQKLKTGQRVRMDAGRGEVRVLV